MSYQVLARKWRPKLFSELVGQKHVVQALVNGLDQDRVHHAFLFSGTRGVGKTTIARIFAKCLNCEQGVTSQPCGVCSACSDIDAGRFVDMIEIDAASRTGVDDMRELLESVQYAPNRGRFKVYIIDEVHMLSKSSFNALLKTMEEPPPHVKFLLATTDPEKIPLTILSRCLQFNLRRLFPGQIESQLAMIVETEGVEAERPALASLSRAADGSMRDGLSLLDQAIAFGGGRITTEQVKQMLGVVEHDHIVAIIQALAGNDAHTLLAIVDQFIAQARDPDTVLLNLAEVMHRICLVQCVPDYRDTERTDWDSIEALAGALPAEDAQLYYQIAIKGRAELNLAPDPRTGLEMTLLRMLAFRPARSNAAEPPVTHPGSDPVAAPGAGNRLASRSSHRVEPADAMRRSRVEPDESSQGKSGAGQAAVETDSPGQRPEPVQDVKEEADWIRFAHQLKLTGPARELARNLHLHSRQGDRWEFAIADSLRHLGSAACVDRVSQAISEQLGTAVMIRLVDGDATPLNTVAGIQEQQLLVKKSDAQKAIDEDSTVRALKETMGARLIEDSIQPLQ